MGRKKKNRKGRSAILIFVEGETEESYFNSFKRANELYGVAIVSLLKGSGDWVDKASSQIRNNPKYKGYDTTHTFLIFDKNNYDESTLNKIFSKAQKRGFKVGFSNNSFEVWLLAHFEEIKRKLLTQKQLEDKLTKHLSSTYTKGDTKQIDKIIENINFAIDNTSSVSSVHFSYQTTNIAEIINSICKVL